MKATITRSGGFAGVTSTHEVDLTHRQLAELKSRSGDEVQPVPDGFTYEVTVHGETFTVHDDAMIEDLIR